MYCGSQFKQKKKRATFFAKPVTPNHEKLTILKKKKLIQNEFLPQLTRLVQPAAPHLFDQIPEKKPMKIAK